MPIVKTKASPLEVLHVAAEAIVWAGLKEERTVGSIVALLARELNRPVRPIG